MRFSVHTKHCKIDEFSVFNLRVWSKPTLCEKCYEITFAEIWHYINKINWIEVNGMWRQREEPGWYWVADFQVLVRHISSPILQYQI